MVRNTGFGFQNRSRKIATLRKIHDVQIYDRIHGSKAIDSGPPNSFSLYSLFYTHTVHGYAQVHTSILCIHIYTYIHIQIYENTAAKNPTHDVTFRKQKMKSTSIAERHLNVYENMSRQ